MQALVTGATGFVGGHLVEALLAGGDRVRCLVRPGSDRRWLPPGAELATGSIDDSATLASAITGVDVVYHLAATTSTARPDDYDRTNRGAVVRLLGVLAAQAPRARLVFCSSLAVGGPSRSGRPLTEADPPAPIGPYGVSKARAEEAIARAGIDAVIIRAPAVYGPRDRDVLAAFRLAARGLAIRTGPRGQRLALIHVRDLVQGLVAGGRTPQAVGIYYVNGENYSWEEITTAIGSAVGRRPVVVPLPAFALRFAGRAARSWARLSGAKPLLTPERVSDLLQRNWTCDDARARTALGYRPTVTLDAGTRDTAAWYRAQGWL
jgi:nucleoside-diphosphate-sugar epimerase